MSTVWDYDAAGMEPADLAGFSVEALDGSIGKIDAATWDTDTAHLVVDTGPWIFGRKVIIPAGMIEMIDLDEESVHLGLTKEQIKNGPEYDEERYQGGAGSEFWEPYDDYYREPPAGFVR